MKQTVSYDDFQKLQILSGTVMRVEPFPRAKKPAYKLWVDFGEEVGVLQTSAQVSYHYTPEALMGKQVLGCVNLGEKNIAGFLSQFLLLGFQDPEGYIRLPVVDPKVQNGQSLC